MSFRKKLKLQPLKIRSRCNDETKVSKIARGSTTVSEKMTAESCKNDAEIVNERPRYINDGDDWPSLINWDELPSCNSIKEEAKVKSWDNIRCSLRNAIVESAAMPFNQLCVLCAEAEALCRCVHCGPNVYYCKDCLYKFHNKMHPLHMPEEWKVHVYI